MGDELWVMDLGYNERIIIFEYIFTSYNEYCSTGSVRLKHVNSNVNNSSDVVSSDINRLL